MTPDDLRKSALEMIVRADQCEAADKPDLAKMFREDAMKTVQDADRLERRIDHLRQTSR